MKQIPVAFFAFLLLAFSCTSVRQSQKFFAGGFTTGSEPGMALFELGTGGQMNQLKAIDAGPNPSFFCFSERHKLIYALNEVTEFQGEKGGGVTTLSYDPSAGNIEKKHEIVVPYGGPCHLSVSADSGYLLIASYGSGSVAVVKLGANGIPETVTDTILYENEQPFVSHPHMISQDPAGRHIYLTDLGLNRILVYNLDKNAGKLVPVENGLIILPKGTGPRHFVFNRDGRRLYVINEQGSSLMVFTIDDKGIPALVQTLPTVREGFSGKNACAGIIMGKDGRFVYGSNRGENSIVVFKAGKDGMLSLAGHSTCGGDWPRSFTIDPTGKYLLSGNQKSDEISIFSIDQKTGMPEGPVGKTKMKGVACIEFLR